jgi:hypothetical protein
MEVPGRRDESMGWTSLEVVRCDQCAIFQPSYDVALHCDGTRYCVACGPPEALEARRSFRPSPLVIAIAVCASLFAIVVTIAELAAG